MPQRWLNSWEALELRSVFGSLQVQTGLAFEGGGGLEGDSCTLTLLLNLVSSPVETQGTDSLRAFFPPKFMLMVYLLQSRFTSEKSWSNGGDSLYKGDYLSAHVAFPRTHFWIVFNDESSSKLLWISPFGPFLTDKSQNCPIPLRDEAF